MAVHPTTDPQRATNTRNEYYDLVSVLYHALEGARTYAIYVQDAMACGDQELAQFFQQCQQNDVNRAERAKQLMATRAGTLGQGMSGQMQGQAQQAPASAQAYPGQQPQR